MSAYPYGNVQDRKMLERMPTEKLIDYLFLHVRNLWRVDGLYFLGVEEKFDTPTATKIDTRVWQIMAKIEAKSLKEMFGIGGDVDIPTIMNLLQKSSWSLDQPFKTFQINGNRGVLSINRCRTQEARLKKGLMEFPCKKVRLSYLKNFAETLNPRVKTNCVICPPDKRPADLWCRWEFKI